MQPADNLFLPIVLTFALFAANVVLKFLVASGAQRRELLTHMGFELSYLAAGISASSLVLLPSTAVAAGVVELNLLVVVLLIVVLITRGAIEGARSYMSGLGAASAILGFVAVFLSVSGYLKLLYVALRGQYTG